MMLDITSLVSCCIFVSAANRIITTADPSSYSEVERILLDEPYGLRPIPEASLLPDAPAEPLPDDITLVTPEECNVDRTPRPSSPFLPTQVILAYTTHLHTWAYSQRVIAGKASIYATALTDWVNQGAHGPLPWNPLAQAQSLPLPTPPAAIAQLATRPAPTRAQPSRAAAHLVPKSPQTLASRAIPISDPHIPTTEPRHYVARKRSAAEL